MKRVCIYPSDIAILLGKSLATAQILLRTIKDALGRTKNQSVTIAEFCEYQGLPYEEVNTMINGSQSKSSIS